MSLTGRYFKVKDGSIVSGPHARAALRHPTVSISAKTTDKELASIGFLPEDRVGYEYDSATQNRTGPAYDVQATKVVATYTVTDKTAQELAAEADAKKEAALGITADDYRIEKAIASTLYDVALAAKTGDWSGFKLADDTPVTSKATFRQYMKEKL